MNEMNGNINPTDTSRPHSMASEDSSKCVLIATSALCSALFLLASLKTYSIVCYLLFELLVVMDLNCIGSEHEDQDNSGQSESLKASKTINPFHKKKGSSIEEFEYINSDPPSSNQWSSQNRRPNKNTASGEMRSTSNLRSTLPLNPFFGEFLDHIRTKNLRKIKEILEDNPSKFYGSVDEMDKTILHCA